MSDSKFPEYPKREPTTAHRGVGEDGGLVVVPGEGNVEVLNAVGSLVYSMLDGQHTREQIVQAIVKEYEVTEEQARSDLQLFLEQLDQKNMLVEAGSNGDASKVETP